MNIRHIRSLRVGIPFSYECLVIKGGVMAPVSVGK